MSMLYPCSGSLHAGLSRMRFLLSNLSLKFRTGIQVVFMLLLIQSTARAQCNEVQILVAASFDTLILCQSNAEFILPNQPLKYDWVARDEMGTLIDSSTQSRFFADLSTRMIDSVSICLKVIDSAGNACALCDTFTFRGSIEHWRPIRNNRGVPLSIPEIRPVQIRNSPGIYDLLGREYPSLRAIPPGTMYIESGIKKTRIGH